MKVNKIKCRKLIWATLFGCLTINAYASSGITYSGNSCTMPDNLNNSVLAYQALYNISVNLTGTQLPGQTITYSVYDNTVNQYVITETTAVVTNGSFLIVFTNTPTLNTLTKHDYVVNIGGISYKKRYKVRTAFEIQDTTNLSCVLHSSSSSLKWVDVWARMIGSIAVTLSYNQGFPKIGNPWMTINFSEPVNNQSGYNYVNRALTTKTSVTYVYLGDKLQKNLVNFNITASLPWSFAPGNSDYQYATPKLGLDNLATITWPSDSSIIKDNSKETNDFLNKFDPSYDY